MTFLIILLINIIFFFLYSNIKNKNNLIFLAINIVITFIINHFLLKVEIGPNNLNFNYMILVFFNSIFLCTIIYSIIFRKNIELKTKYIYKFLFILSISIFLEIGIFNFRHFESLNYNEVKINNYKNNNNTIEIKNVNKEINNLYLDIANLNTIETKVSIYATDEANENYLLLPQRTLINNLESLKYIKMNLSGKVKNLKIEFKTNNEKIQINNIIINKTKPIFLSKVRFIIIILSISFLYIIWPTSFIYNYKFSPKTKKIVTISYVIIQTIFWISIIKMNPIWISKTVYMNNQEQYNQLADSLLKGNVNLDLPVSKTLKSMKNPYDFVEREKLHKNNNEQYFLDHSFYKEKYYVYFGVVPCILFYLPYKFITGNNLVNSYVILLMLIGNTILILKLLKALIDKYFPKVNFINYLLISILFINCCGMLYIARRADFYSVPIITSLFFSLLGLYLWITSIKKDNLLNRKKLFLGSISMALVAGCRPQFLLTSFFSLIIFKDYVLKNKNDKKKLFKDFVIFCIPYIIIAIMIMYYNYIRFDSPFDFGANYNLTGNDMTKRGFKFDRIFLGIFYFIFSSTSILPTFPFVNYIDLKTNYMGLTIYEPMWGGILFDNIILILGLISFKFKNLIKDKSLWIFTIMCNLFAIIIVVVDTQMAGILPRYITDFSWLLFLSTSITLFAIFNSIKEKEFKIFNCLFVGLFLLSIFYNFILIPTDLSLSIYEFNKMLYFKIYTYVQFWL